MHADKHRCWKHCMLVAIFLSSNDLFLFLNWKKKLGSNNKSNMYEKFRKYRFIILTRVKDDGQRCEHPYWNEFIISCMILNEIYCNCHAIKQTGLNDSKQTNKQTENERREKWTEQSNKHQPRRTMLNSFYFPQSLMQRPRKALTNTLTHTPMATATTVHIKNQTNKPSTGDIISKWKTKLWKNDRN